MAWQVIAGYYRRYGGRGRLLFFQPCDEEDAVTAQVAAFRPGRAYKAPTSTRPAGRTTSVQQGLPLVRVLRRAAG